MNTKSYINSCLKIVLITFLGIMCFTGCTEEDFENEGTPVINMVRTADEPDVALETGGLGETVIINGDNFSTVERIMINDYEVDFLPTFVTKTNIVLQIPEDTPTLATSPDVNNKITIITSKGMATYDFTVLPPPPVVESISNEFALEGEELIIKGKYFFFVEDVIFPGDISATDISSSSDGTTIMATVPGGITEAGTITVVTQSGENNALPRHTFNDRSGVILDWDEHTFWQNWGVSPGVKADGFNGNYLHIVAGGPILPSSWWVGPSAFVIDGVQDNSGITPQNMTGPSSDYVLRMEINIPASAPWNSGWFELENGNDDYFGRLMPWTSPWLNSDGILVWNSPDPDDLGTSSFHTDGNWQTIDYPLNHMARKDGDIIISQPATSIEDLLTDGKFEVRLAFQNPDTGIEIKNGLDIKFDNFRVVKIK